MASTCRLRQIRPSASNCANFQIDAGTALDIQVTVNLTPLSPHGFEAKEICRRIGRVGTALASSVCGRRYDNSDVALLTDTEGDTR